MANGTTLTLRQILSLYEALAALDGHTEVIFNEKGEPQKGKTTPYQFGIDGKGGSKLRYSIVRNLAILKRHVDAYQKVRDALLVQISGGSGTIDKTDGERIGRLNTETSKLLDQEETVTGLFNISLAELNLDGNPLLANSTVAVLDQLLVD